MDVEQFRKLPVLGIVRGADLAAIEPLVETAIAAGLRTLEVTMNTPDAAALIRRAVDVAAGRMSIGAGTVLSLDELNAATAAGATFAVMPTLVRDVVGACIERRLPVFPGALTPQEIFDAWRAGATMVKVFPARFFGPEYFKEIKGPFADIELLACGGVEAANLAAFIGAGASAVAFGGSVFRRDWLAERRWDRIDEAIRALLSAYTAAVDTAR